MANSTLTACERADQLIDILAENELSTELHERIREWFLDAPQDGTVEAALAAWVGRRVKAVTAAPDAQTRESFRRLAARLGFASGELAPKARRIAPLRRVALRVAAVLVPALIVAGAAFWLFDKPAAPIEETVLAVAAGETAVFTLPDGSTVRLTDDSQLTYPDDFSTNRRVDLDGEAFFVVTRDAEHPFTVQNDSLNIRVLGTEFYVDGHRGKSSAQVILTRGSVAVEAGVRRATMVPGDKIVVDKASGYAFESSLSSAGERMRVSGGTFTVDNLPAREALQLAADYFDRALVVAPDTPAGEPVSVIAPAQASLEEVLRTIDILSATVGGRVEGDTIVVSRK